MTVGTGVFSGLILESKEKGPLLCLLSDLLSFYRKGLLHSEADLDAYTVNDVNNKIIMLCMCYSCFG